ncbi:MAG: hypothetical protein R6U17_03530 [Thermoplasmata archaeon]
MEKRDDHTKQTAPTPQQHMENVCVNVVYVDLVLLVYLFHRDEEKQDGEGACQVFSDI